MSTNKLSSLILRVFLWLPACIACWYLFADYLNYPAVKLSAWLLHYGFHAWVDSVEWANGMMTLVTSLEVSGYPGGAPGQVAVLVVEVRPSLYSYGLPLFMALMLASNGPRNMHHLLLGCLMLVPFQVWGLCFDLLKQVAITSAPAVIAQANFAPWQREIIALGYQFGYLVIPTLSPIGVWIGFNHQILPIQIQQFKRRQPVKKRRPGH